MKTGIQGTCNYLKILDSRFHGNDKKLLFRIYYESIKVREVFEISDRVYVLAMGKVVAEDAPVNLSKGRIKELFL